MRLVPCPCVVLNGHGRNSSRHATWRTPRRTGRRRLLADFPGHRHAIPERSAMVRQRAAEPGARVSDRDAELKDPPRTGRAREDMEQTSLRRPDDRQSFLLALSLHGPKRRVSPVRQPIDVFVDLLVHDCARHATTAATSVVCRYEPSRQLDKHLSHMSGHRGAGWDMCKLTKTDSAVLSLYLETLYVNEIMARGYAVPPNLEVPAA